MAVKLEKSCKYYLKCSNNFIVDCTTQYFQSGLFNQGSKSSSESKILITRNHTWCHYYLYKSFPSVYTSIVTRLSYFILAWNESYLFVDAPIFSCINLITFYKFVNFLIAILVCIYWQLSLTIFVLYTQSKLANYQCSTCTFRSSPKLERGSIENIHLVRFRELSRNCGSRSKPFYTQV